MGTTRLWGTPDPIESGAGEVTTYTPRVAVASGTFAAGTMLPTYWRMTLVTPSNVISPVPVANSINFSTYLAYADCVYGLRYIMQNCGVQPVEVRFGSDNDGGIYLAAGTAAKDGKGGSLTGTLSKTPGTLPMDYHVYFMSTVADADRLIRIQFEVF